MSLLRQVLEKGLCLGCGTCAGVCPANAINMHMSEGLFVPEIDESKCTKCQLCIKCCPGHSVDFNRLSSHVDGGYRHNLVGNHLSCYVGYSTDESIRFDSTSGGLITQILIFALENGLVDGVITTRMRMNNPLEPESFIARTPGEIIEASKSKYCPVAANVALKEILREKGVFYAVGLPCHIHGIRKAQSVIKDLRKKIVLTFGLLCSHTVDFAGTSLLLQKMRFKESDIASIRYRGEGWPGFMTIKTKSGVSKKIPLFRSWNAYWPLFSSFFFTPMRCTMCPDQTAELADISFGDAWLPEFKKEKKGMSIVVTRSNAGEALIKHAESAKKISLTPAVIEKVVESQRVNLKFKKNDLNSRLSFLKLMGKATPSFTPSFPDSASIACTMRTAYIYSGIRASSNKTFRSILANAPLPLVRSYYGVYKYLSIV